MATEKATEKASSDRSKALDTALAQIERQFGKGAVMKMSERANAVVEVIPTGSISLDIALGIGGLPRGRVVEIYGPESSGKTTLALHAIANAQRAGGIAALIAASAFLIIGVAIAYAVIRLGRAIDEVGGAVRDIAKETAPLLNEVTTTVELVNGPLQSINKVTKTMEDFTSKVSESASGFLDKNQMAMKAAGAVLTAAQLRKKKKGKKSKKAKSSKYVDDEEF